MKPYKFFSMSMFTLLCLAIIYNGKLNFDSNDIMVIIMDSVFSFLLPAVIFFSAWLISYNRKNEDKNIFNFYGKVLLNFVLPYFLCMIPYIIYKFGNNNLEINEFINIFLNGNIIKQFEYVKIIIHLLIIYPLVEYFVKQNAKLTVIISLIISMIFSLFSLDTYIYTNIFNYIIYLSLRHFIFLSYKRCCIFFEK